MGYHRVFEASNITILCAILLLTLVLRRCLGRRNDKDFYSLSPLPQPQSPSFFSGHVPLLFDRKTGLAYHERLTKEYGRVIRLKGILGADTLYISGARALTAIVNREEFHEHPSHILCCLLAFGPGLLSSHGNQHKKLRKILNPVFTTHQMQQLVSVFASVAAKLRDTLIKIQGKTDGDIDMLDWVSRTALELIGQGVLGYSFKALDNEDDPYGYAARQLMPAYAPFRLGILLKVLPGFDYGRITSFMPHLQRRIIDVTPVAAVQRLKSVIDVINRSTTEILDRKGANLIKHEDISGDSDEGKDIMSVILKANANASADSRLAKHEVHALVSELVFSAHDTSSGSISRTLSILASRPDIQEDLRKEIKANKETHDMLDFAAIERLRLLDAVCKETLRLHPPVTVVPREVVQDTIIPLGSENGSLPVPKGTSIFCSIRAENRDKETWGPDADEWTPARWLQPLPNSVSQARFSGVFSSMMTFFGGKRACIGYKFAILEMKVVLLTLLEAFEFREGSAAVNWEFGMTLSPIPAGQEMPGMPLRLRPVEKS